MLDYYINTVHLFLLISWVTETWSHCCQKHSGATLLNCPYLELQSIYHSTITYIVDQVIQKRSNPFLYHSVMSLSEILDIILKKMERYQKVKWVWCVTIVWIVWTDQIMDKRLLVSRYVIM